MSSFTAIASGLVFRLLAGAGYMMMLAGCTLPLLLIFIAPLLGIKGDWSTFIFIIAMMACHLFMPMHYGHANHSQKDRHESHTH